MYLSSGGGCRLELDQSSETLEYQILRRITPIFVDTNNCWLNKKDINKNNYQRIKVNNKSTQAHIFSALLFLNHNRTSKLIVCHHCDIPACFNPFHLFLGTNHENIKDGIIKRGVQTVAEKIEISKASLVERIRDVAESPNYDHLSDDDVLEEFFKNPEF